MRNKLILILLLATSLPAAAHVTLTEPAAKPGTAYLAHFRVGHGCDGSPTTALSIAIPQTVSDVRPQPAPGWTLQTGKTNGVETVTWSGGVLAADHPGEFVIAMMLPAATGNLAFPVTQTCEKGVVQWSDLPAADGHRLDHPAPILTLSPSPGKAMPDMPGMKM